MRALGIRAQRAQIHYSVIEETHEEYIIHATEKFIVPQALDMPDRLSYIRTSFESIIREFKVTNAGIRISEMSRTITSSTIERVYIEGVLQELLSNCSVNNYFAGRKNTIARLLETTSKDITEIIDGNKDYFDIEDWTDYSIEIREAIVVAFASIKIRRSHGQ